MAKRKQLWHPDEVRQKIQVSQLINRLTDNALSKEEIMSTSQVRSAQILIDKAIPNLSAMTVGGDSQSPLVINVNIGGDDNNR